MANFQKFPKISLKKLYTEKSLWTSEFLPLFRFSASLRLSAFLWLSAALRLSDVFTNVFTKVFTNFFAWITRTFSADHPLDDPIMSELSISYPFITQILETKNLSHLSYFQSFSSGVKTLN